MTRSDSPRSTSHSRSVPSPLPLSRLRLSGVKARPYTTALCPSSAARALPAFPSHSQIVWSKLPLASVPPSGLQATQCTLSVCPTSVWRPRRLPVAPTSQSLTLPSQLALASRLPLGAKASPRTQLLCPQSVCTQRAGPVLRISHSRIVPAKSPLASRRPCPISSLAVVTSLLVTYSSTTDCKVKLPARCPRSMSERRRSPSTASSTWTCASGDTSSASRSSRVTGSRRIASQHSTVCSRGERRAHCSSSSSVMLPKTTVPPARNGSILPPKRSAMVSATMFKASGLPA